MSRRKKRGQRIRDLRHKAQLSLEAAAHRSGLSWQTWQRAETDAVATQIDTLQRIAKVLGVAVKDLL